MLYISVLILSIIFTVGSFTVISEKQINQESGNASMQTVNVLKKNDLCLKTQLSFQI